MTKDEIMALVYKYGSLCWSHGTEGEQEIAENNVSAAIERAEQEVAVNYDAAARVMAQRVERAEQEVAELRALLIEAREWLVYTTPLQERQKLLARIDAKVKP